MSLLKNPWYSVTYILNGDQVLLGRKKRGFGKGLLVGPGGKPTFEETLFKCQQRETFEETGLYPENSVLKGIVTFHKESDARYPLNVAYYRSRSFSGALQESDELVPNWYKYSNLDFASMWPNDFLHLPTGIISEQYFVGHVHFTYSPPGEEVFELLSYRIDWFNTVTSMELRLYETILDHGLTLSIHNSFLASQDVSNIPSLWSSFLKFLRSP